MALDLLKRKIGERDTKKVETRSSETPKQRMERLLKAVGNAMPYRKRFSELLIFSGKEKTIPSLFIGKLILFSVFLGLGSLFSSLLFTSLLNSMVAGLLGLLAPQLLVWLSLTLTADSKARKVELILPDALQLMSANIRSGMTLNRAIWLSARPEFGPLEEEIRRIGAQTLGGKPLDEALRSISARVDSKILDRAIRLIIEGMRSGGEMASLLDETAEDIRITHAIKEEIKSSVMMYSMFIIFATVLGAPMLFSVSIYFVKTTGSLWSAQTGTDYSEFSTGFLKPSAPTITSDDLTIFAIESITLSTAFGAILIGLIQTGKAKLGVRYILPLTGFGLIMFFTALFVVGSLFSGLVVV